MNQTSNWSIPNAQHFSFSEFSGSVDSDSADADNMKGLKECDLRSEEELVLTIPSPRNSNSKILDSTSSTPTEFSNLLECE